MNNLEKRRKAEDKKWDKKFIEDMQRITDDLHAILAYCDAGLFDEINEMFQKLKAMKEKKEEK